MPTYSDGAAAVAALHAWLGRLVIETPLRYEAVTVFPVTTRSPAPAGERYRVLRDALADGSVVVREKDHPTVPFLTVVNDNPIPVLLLSGEEVLGGLQNRVIAETMLVPARTRMDIPVLCVEARRWATAPRPAPGHDAADRERANEPRRDAATEDDLRRAFRAGGKEFLSLRRARNTWQMDAAGELRSAVDQADEWAAIAALERRLAVASSTGAMRDIFTAKRDEIGRIAHTLRYPDGVLGMVVGLGAAVVGADLFDQPRSAALLWDCLVESYAVEALETTATAAATAEQAVELLEDARSGRAQASAGAGLGTLVRFAGAIATGHALVYEAAPVYAAIHRRDDGHRPSPTRARIARASQRRAL